MIVVTRCTFFIVMWPLYNNSICNCINFFFGNINLIPIIIINIDILIITYIHYYSCSLNLDTHNIIDIIMGKW